MSKKIVTLDNLEYFYKKLETTVPTKTSDLTNDSGFITINDVPVLEIPDEYVTDEELSQKGYATEEWINNNNYATEYNLNNIVGVLNQSIASKQDKIDNIVIAEDVDEELDNAEINTYVKYVAQTLTEEQKSQVRSNIGVNLTDYAKKSDLSNVATSGSYNDLTNKPTVLSESDVNNLIDTKIGDINSILENIINGN